ncbi:phage tail spike protein, partial [Helcococcus bovis]|uniref:phage tail spike protein n=1 Tax=Helcococcus bovis TaxID=3153252 RepID=UPI0038B8F8C3
MIYLFDKKLNLKKIISDPLESIQEWELNNLITLDVVIPYDKSHEGYSYVGHKLRNEFYLYKIRNEIKDDNTLKIKGVHILFDDLKGIVIKDKRYLNGENTMIVLKETLDESGWEVDGIGDIPDFKGNFYYKSVLSAFNKILEYTNIQYRPIIEFTNNKISRKTIKVSKKIGRDYGKWFEYGDKLVSVIAEQSHEDVYTAFIGRGKGLPTLDEEGIETGGYGRRITIKDVEWKISKGDPVDKPLGQEFIEIKEATELYGYPNGKPKTYVKNFENIEDEKELIQSTYEYAIENSRPKIQMKASAISDNPVEIGEIVAVINPKMNIRYKTIIFKIKTDLISGLQEFEFGEKIALSGVERTIQQEKRNEERLQEVKSILITRLENMGLDFFKKDGFPIVLEQNNKYNLPGGFYVFDRPIDKEPQSFVGIGGDGIIFANGKNLDGNWKIQTAIDGNGVAGESIIT